MNPHGSALIARTNILWYYIILHNVSLCPFICKIGIILVADDTDTILEWFHWRSPTLYKSFSSQAETFSDWRSHYPRTFDKKIHRTFIRHHDFLATTKYQLLVYNDVLIIFHHFVTLIFFYNYRSQLECYISVWSAKLVLSVQHYVSSFISSISGLVSSKIMRKWENSKNSLFSGAPFKMFSLADRII